jgi:hypothetical protein
MEDDMAFGYAVYFSERGAGRVVRWDPDSGAVGIVAGQLNPRGSDQNLSEPYGLAFDPDGHLLIADKHNHRICRVQNGRLIALNLRDETGHRNRRPDSPAFYEPDSLYSPSSLFQEKSGALLATFYDDNTIYRVHPNGRLEHVLGAIRNRPYLVGSPRQHIPPAEAASEPIRGPVGAVSRSDGTIFFIERHIQVVREFHPARGLRSVFSLDQAPVWMMRSEAPERGTLDAYHPMSPSSLALDGQEVLHLCDNLHQCVLKIDVATGTFERKASIPRGAADPSDGGPVAVTFGPDGTAWVAESASGSIRAWPVAADGTWSPGSTSLPPENQDPLALLPGGMGLIVGSK